MKLLALTTFVSLGHSLTTEANSESCVKFELTYHEFRRYGVKALLSPEFNSISTLELWRDNRPIAIKGETFTPDYRVHTPGTADGQVFVGAWKQQIVAVKKFHSEPSRPIQHEVAINEFLTDLKARNPELFPKNFEISPVIDFDLEARALIRPFHEGLTLDEIRSAATRNPHELLFEGKTIRQLFEEGNAALNQLELIHKTQAWKDFRQRTQYPRGSIDAVSGNLIFSNGKWILIDP